MLCLMAKDIRHNQQDEVSDENLIHCFNLLAEILDRPHSDDENSDTAKPGKPYLIKNGVKIIF